MSKGRIHSIETFAAVDGPGLRVAVFLQGCPQRCIYCHNPDTWNAAGGEEAAPEELVKKIIRYRPYFKRGGGVTLSGGEPFMQAEFVTELLKLLKAEKMHTAVDTCGFYLTPQVKKALEYTDLVLLDIKHTDPGSFKIITKQSFFHTTSFLAYMKETQKPLWIRQVILPGYTDNEQQVRALLAMLDGANVERIELLPYHTLGRQKWDELGIPYEIAHIHPPSAETMHTLRRLTEAYLHKKSAP